MNQQVLKAAGIDYQDGLRRLSGDITSYEEIVSEFISDPTFLKFCEEMEKDNYKKAFEYLHSLKGLTSNLSFIRFTNIVSKMVEMLRNQSDIDGAKDYYPTVKEEYNILINAIRDSNA